MGKVKTIDPEKQEQLAKEKAAKEAERLARIEAAKSAGQVKKTEVEPAKEEVKAAEAPAEEKKEKKVSKYAAKKGVSVKRERSANYKKAAAFIDKAKHYPVKEAMELLEKAHLAKFDETVELHINTTQTGISGQVVLPHGTGKTIRVAILAPSKDAKAADELLKQIEAGKIGFDVLVATPDAMPRLARVAKVLGPRGLMPNPKNGTITTNPEAVAKQYEGGQFFFKTEAKMPLLHVAVGKLSFGADKLSENISAMLRAVKMENIKKVVVKSTMSPAVKLHLGK